MMSKNYTFQNFVKKEEKEKKEQKKGAKNEEKTILKKKTETIRIKGKIKLTKTT